jgi:hypothetical protein
MTIDFQLISKLKLFLGRSTQSSELVDEHLALTAPGVGAVLSIPIRLSSPGYDGTGNRIPDTANFYCKSIESSVFQRFVTSST